MLGRNEIIHIKYFMYSEQYKGLKINFSETLGKHLQQTASPYTPNSARPGGWIKAVPPSAPSP